MAETYKIINAISPPIMEFFFILRENRHNVKNFKKYLIKIAKQKSTE